jgi:hypothetical protein
MMMAPLNLYSVCLGERPLLIREAIHLTEKVVLIDDEITDPFALIIAESEDRAYEIGAPLFMSD